MKKYVQIQSDIDINVTAGLNMKNMTKVNSDIPDRLTVMPTWPRLTVLIKQGAHLYPSVITEWNTVKALARNKLITIGTDTDDAGGDQELLSVERDLNVALADPGFKPVDDEPTIGKKVESIIGKKDIAQTKAEREETLEEIVAD